VQTSGASLTAQQPEVNVVRTTLEALAAVLGGTQSLHTNAMDEVLGLPTEHAAHLALRTQQVIAHESGVTAVPDPLGGSTYVEALTDDMVAGAEAMLARVAEWGNGSILEGVYAAVEAGWFQARIAESAYELARKLDAGERVVVGVNRFTEPGPDDERAPIDVFTPDPAVEERQRKRLAEVKAQRSHAAVSGALAQVTADAREPTRNLMPAILEAVRAHATEGEIVDALAEVFGRWTETPVLP
jgi:methylmalonyl-CoA mutase N-terminal domain/subunit